MEDRNKAINTVVDLLVILILFSVFWSPVLFHKGEIFFNLDHSFQNIPFRCYAFAQFNKGKIALWCNKSALGFPMFSEGQSGIAFFPNWIFYYSLPFTQAYNFSIIFLLLFSGIGMYLLLKSIDTPSHAALVGVVSWMYSTQFIHKLMFVNMVQCFALSPFILWGWVQFSRTGKKHFWFISTSLVGLQILAGHPQSAFIGIIILISFILFAPAELGFRQRLGDVFRFVVPGIMLGFWQWLPTLRMMLNSSRSLISHDALVGQMSFPPAFFLNFFLPDFFGNAAFKTFTGNWGAYEWEISSYLGITIILLAGHADFRDKWNRFLLKFSIFFFLLSLGKYTLILELFKWVPLMNSLRIPSRWLIIMQLCISMLAARGLGRIIGQSALGFRKILIPYRFFFVMCFLLISFLSTASYLTAQNGLRKHIIASSCITAVLLFTALSISIGLMIRFRFLKLFSLIIVVICFIDLFLSNAQYPGTCSAKEIFKKPEALQEIADDFEPQNDRILSLLHEPVMPWKWHEGWNLQGRGDYGHLMSTLPMYSGLIFNFQGFTFNEWSPLHSARYLQIVQGLNEQMLNRMGVKYILIPQHKRMPFHFPTVFTGKNFLICKNSHALSRFNLVKPVPVVNGMQALQMVNSHYYKPNKIAFVEGKTGLCDKNPGKLDVLDTIDSRKDFAEINVDLKSNGCLISNDAFDSGWRALVDGRPVPVYHADFLFMGIFLKKGRHKVTFSYYPLDYKLGLFFTCITIMMLIATALRKWEEERTAEFQKIYPAWDAASALFWIFSLIVLITGIVFKVSLWADSFRNLF